MGIAAPLPPSGRAAGEGVGLAVACPVPGQGGVGSGQGSLGGSHPELTGVKAAHRMDRSQADLTHTGGRTGEGMADVGGIAEEEEQDELEEYALVEEQGVEPGLRLQSVIPHGKKYERRWLLGSLQSVCIRPFNPIHYYTEGSRVQFYLQDAAAAEALSRVSRQITDTQGYKVTVLMNPCPPPAFTHSDLTARGLEQLQRCLAKRYDELQRALDLSSIRTDPDLVSQSVDVILNRKTCMQAVIKIIQENITELVSLNLSHNRLFKTDDVAELVTKVPSLRALNLSHNQLKSERDLDKLKVQRLEELWLDRNPVCDLFKDQHSYISAIRQRFPLLLKLDGHELPAPIGFDVETGAVAPPCKGSYFGSDEVKSLILHFLQQYYSVYDSGDRQPLLDAYHDGACFSLCLPIIQNPARCTLGEYHKHSRNLRNVRDSTLRFRLLKHTRLQVVTFLNELPKTQHDTASFIIDVNTHTSALLCFTVSGVFKEVEGRCRDSVRAFSRVFITVPAGNSGMCVVSEELFVRSATAQDVNRAFAAPGPTPASSPTLSGSSTPVLSTPQQEMLSAFTLQSGMNQEWSQKCLQDNDWDFQQAAQIFSQLKAQGKIPGVAFIR